MKRHDVKMILELARPYTMVHDVGVSFTSQAAIEAIQRDIPGDFVECGVWRGGCSLAMLLAQRMTFGEVRRRVHMFDSFEGLPPVSARDGVAAREWQENNGHNCAASVDELHEMLGHFHFSEHTDFSVWPGWFKSTLPMFKWFEDGLGYNHDRKIAVLRLDGDWYDSTRECLDELMPLVSDGGVVIIDDYFAWDGCARAVHDYLSCHDLPYRIRSLNNHSSAYFVKTEKTETSGETSET